MNEIMQYSQNLSCVNFQRITEIESYKTSGYYKQWREIKIKVTQHKYIV